MADHDPQWGMPEVDWQPTSSFNSPIAPPLDDPLVAPLVQLPCVNQQWVPIILGCLAQLTNPGVWLQSLTDDQRSLVLNRVDNLRSAMAGTVSTPCCDVQIRLTGDCKLQFSVDGGATYSDVAGWTTNLCGCVQGCIVPAVPPNPNPPNPAVDACNDAAWLAVQLQEKVWQDLSNIRSTTNNVNDFIHNLAVDIASLSPVTDLLLLAFDTFFGAGQSQTTSDLAAVAADSVFWELVKCAIYSAIKPVGYVNGANLATVSANIAAIPYSRPWAPPMVANLVSNLGLIGMQALQAEGHLVGADCSACASAFCKEFDVRLNMQGYTPGDATSPTWTAGVGWKGAFESGPNVTRLWISQGISAWGGLVSVNQVAVHYFQAGAGDGSNINHTPHINLFNGGSVVKTINLPLGPVADGKYVFAVSPPVMADSFDFYVISEGSVTLPVLAFSEVLGTTTGTFLGDTCPD